MIPFHQAPCLAADGPWTQYHVTCTAAQWQPYPRHQVGPQWQHQLPSLRWHDYPQILPGDGVHRRAWGASWQQQQLGWHDNLQERSEVQLHAGAPDISWQQQPPSLGWHDSSLEPSRAGPNKGSLKHLRAGAHGVQVLQATVYITCPPRCCTNCAQRHNLALTVALLCCCPKTQPSDPSSPPQAAPHAGPQAASQLHLYDVQDLRCVFKLSAYSVSQTQMSWPCCMQRLACRCEMQ